MHLEYGDQRIPVAAEDVVIGSDPGATVRLAGPSVLPRHALVRRVGANLVVIHPVDSQSDIRVNGSRIGRDPTPLLHGDRIGIGGHELTVVDPARSGATEVLTAAGQGAPSRDPAPPTPRRGPASRLVSLTDGREYPIDVAPFVLGRDAGSHVVLASPDASRRHAEIVARPDGDVLVDLSTNGAHVNGQRIAGRHVLRALDVIRIGAEEFRYYPPPAVGAEFRLSDTLIGFRPTRPTPAAPSSPPPPTPPAAAGPAPLASLLVKSGARKGDRFAIRAPVANLGRADYNDVAVGDPSISASHAKLQLREGVWTISDLGSTNGTAVDGEAVVDEAPLSPGCSIRLGEVTLLFEPKDEGAQRVAGTTVLPKPPRPPEPPAPVESPPLAESAPLAAAVPVRRPPASSANQSVRLLIGVLLLLGALAVLVLVL
jgi:pSer/pThr/pTyr-binding forkhead associated (FHA) protein